MAALQRPADFDNPTLDLAFDNAAPIPSGLVPVINDEVWGFASRMDLPGFWALIDALKRHKTVEAIFRQAGRELRTRFTLSGADAAIGYVEKKCAAVGPG